MSCFSYLNNLTDFNTSLKCEDNLFLPHELPHIVLRCLNALVPLYGLNILPSPASEVPLP